MNDIRFILASQSPRRRELLGLLGYSYECVVSGADEEAHIEAGPATYVLRTARHKAELVAAAETAAIQTAELAVNSAGEMTAIPAGGRRLIIAADTTVALAGEILGKPRDAAEARQMLRALGGRTHEVHTGLCVVEPATGRELSAVHTAAVTMRAYGLDEIDAYVATGDPLDKAGAYAIQHPAFNPVERLDGCYLGVMGLSLCELIVLLRRLDVPTRADRAALAAAHRGYPCPIFDSLWWGE